MTDDKTKIAADTDEHFVALHSGFTLGKYELQAVLGQGGFGITYKAWDSALNRAVAIKEYLPSDVAVRVDGSTVKARSRNDQESFQWGLERFLEEARALARFEASQSIVRVYDYMQANGTAYMVMALIEGTPLSSVYRREAPLSEERLKAIVLPILDGLDDVHLAGFLHRDIKPANILIRPNGAPVLIDFGAARNALGEKSRSITSVFTPGYAPFEQYTSSGKQGPWTDIYALAATLYHGITGKPPPQATDRIRDDPMLPAVHAGAGHYSPQFLASVDRGLEVFENRRPQSIGQWRDMLTGATTLAVPQSYAGAAPQQPAAGYAPNSQAGNTAVPTLGERGVPSQAPNSQGPISQGPASQAPYSQTPISQAPRKSRMPLIAAAVALVLVGGGAAAFFALSPSSERAAEETVQQRAQRLADEAKRAADQARLAQDAAEAEMKKQAEQEAKQKEAEQARAAQDAALARQAEQARRDSERAQRDSDGEAKRKADEEVRKIAEAEAARRLETEKLEQERRALEAARAKAEAELAEARRQAEEARAQADALRAQAEQSRAAAAEADARRKAEDEARKKAEAEAKVKAEAAAKKKAEDDAKAKADAAIAAKKKAEDEARAKAEAAAKAKADEEVRRAQAARAPAAVPAPVAAPPPPISSADVRAAPAPSTQQAANAPTTPGFAYAGRYGVTIDCPQVDQPPFAQYGTSIAGPQFAWDFYRDGKGTGTISGDSMSYRISFTGRSGNAFTGSFSLRATAEGFRGSGIVSGFGPNRNGEKSCPIVFKKR